MNAATDRQSPFWVSHVESLVNTALALDEETLHALGQLDGKVIAFELINTRLTLFLFPTAQGLKILTEHDVKADVRIKGTPGNFVMMLASGKDGKSALPADMELAGDIGLAQRFQEIMQNVEIDLEEPLSRWVGDTVAHRIGRFVRDGRKFMLNTGQTLATDISEYLRFEIEMLPDDLLVEEFCRDVDRLREDVDRFTQRLNKLEAQYNNNQDN